MIQDNAVTRGKIAQNSVNSAKVEDASIQSKDLAGSIRGQRGVPGRKGGSGAAGPRGAAGKKGDAGVAGTQGPVGAAGSQGPAGAAGIGGRTSLSGSTEPASLTGKDGDFYINTTTDTLFGPQDSGIDLMTPEAVHYGQATRLHAQRARVLTDAYARMPERFVRQPPQPPALPAAVWINKPTPQEIAH